MEAFKITEEFSGIPQSYEYIDKNREGDHICYYSDLTKMKLHYPSWDITISLNDTIKQIVESWSVRL